MKVIFTILLSILVQFVTIAQEDDEPMYYNREVSVDIGTMASANSHNNTNIIIGTTYDFQTAYYFKRNLGIRTGINLAQDLDGADKFISIPVYLAYRTDIHRRFQPNFETCNDFLLSLILFIFPNNLEFNVGPNFGYFSERSGLHTISTDGGKNYYSEGYKLNSNMAFSLDAGIKGKLYIWRIGLVGSFTVCYMPTKNFTFQSPNKELNGLSPHTFVRGTLGLTFNF